MNLEQHYNHLKVGYAPYPPFPSPEFTGKPTHSQQELNIDIKVAEYLVHVCQYSFKEYLELSPSFRQELNQSTLAYLTEKKSTVKE